MTEENSTKLRKIKQSFRLYMNGDASRSMREKGVEYKLNWGVPIPTLKAMAAEYGKDYELAIALWKENIRECKILATMIMPPEQTRIPAFCAVLMISSLSSIVWVVQISGK